jgi:hypothetical protein
MVKKTTTTTTNESIQSEDDEAQPSFGQVQTTNAPEDIVKPKKRVSNPLSEEAKIARAKNLDKGRERLLLNRVRKRQEKRDEMEKEVIAGLKKKILSEEEEIEANEVETVESEESDESEESESESESDDEVVVYKPIRSKKQVLKKATKATNAKVVKKSTRTPRNSTGIDAELIKQLQAMQSQLDLLTPKETKEKSVKQTTHKEQMIKATANKILNF